MENLDLSRAAELNQYHNLIQGEPISRTAVLGLEVDDEYASSYAVAYPAPRTYNPQEYAQALQGPVISDIESPTHKKDELNRYIGQFLVDQE